MTEDEINRQVSKETGSMSSVSVGIDLDNQALRGLQDTVQAINKEAKEMATNFKEALEALKEMGKDYGLTQVISSTEISSSGTSGAPQRGAAGTTIVGGRAHEAKPVTPAVDSVSAALGGFKALTGAFQAGAGAVPAFAAGGNNIKGRELTTGGTGAIGLAEKFQAGGFTSAGNFASMAGTLAKVGVQAIDKRVEDARPYVLAADKSTLQMQQITGMSQRGVMDNLRMPLTDYKLGTNGINQLMSLQARTGINASQQASSVEFMRTLSGFSMGAEGASNIIESLAAPETVNQMYMMTGMSLIGPGGKQKSAQSLIQGLAKRAGLDNKNIAESAIAPGSVTRATLSAMGVSGDLQDQVIQYGQANNNFREKGGKGSYDPTKEADRKRMGIDDTYAMEAEETERRRGKRDEQFYRDQAGSYAKLERQTQTLTDAMAKLEHAIAPIISARTGSRVAQKILGGFGSMLSNLPVVGGVFGSIGSIFAGDPYPSNSRYIGDPGDIYDDLPPAWSPGTTIPGGGGGGGTPPPTTTPPGGTTPSWLLSQNKWREGFNKDSVRAGLALGDTGSSHSYEEVMNDTMLDAAGNPIPNSLSVTSGPFSELNGSLGMSIQKMAVMAWREKGLTINVASGKRSTEDQRGLWNQRYEVVPSNYNKSYFVDGYDMKKYSLIKHDGKLWKKKDNDRNPPVLPPGNSLHELGLAADLDLSNPKVAEYVKNNLYRFGLVSGDGEPQHVQLAWTKNMTATQFLGETSSVNKSPEEMADWLATRTNINGIGKDENDVARGGGYSGGLRGAGVEWGQKISPGFGVSQYEFGKAFLQKFGEVGGFPITVTVPKLKLLRAISMREGSGGMFNPFNVVTGNNRKTADLLDRPETNLNMNGSHPVQHFDSFEQGVANTLHHYMQNDVIMKILQLDNPTDAQVEEAINNLIIADIRDGDNPVNKRKILANFKTLGPLANDTGSLKKVNNIRLAFGSEGVNTAFGLDPGTDWNSVKGWSGDPMAGSSMQPMSIPSSPMLSSSGSSGGGGNYHEGSTVTISPVINMTSTGNSGAVSEYDLRSMAKKIAKLIEQESNITKFRSM